MIPERSLKDMPVPKIINFLNEVGRTGILTVKKGDQWVRVYFKRGEIVDLESSHMPELSLADFIKRRGLIPEDKLKEYANEAIGAGRRLGEYLVERKLISPHDFSEILHLHIVSKLFKISSWTEGEFTFEEKEFPSSPYHVLDLNIAAIIYQGIKEYLDLPKLPVEFRGRKESIVYKSLNPRFRFDDLPLSTKELRLYQLIDGTRTLRQLVLMSKMPRKKAYMALYALYLLKFITFTEPRVMELEPERREEEKKEEERLAPARERGYELRVDSRLIDEALKAVERAEQSAAREERVEGEPVELEPDELLVVQALEEEEGEEERVAEEERAAEPEVPTDMLAGRPAPTTETPVVPPETYMPEPEAEATTDVVIEEVPPEPPRPEASVMEGISAEDAAAALGPTEAFARGKAFMEREHYYEALPFLRRAAQGDPDNAEVYPYLAWATYQTSAKTAADFREAEDALKAAIQKDPSSYLPFLF
ncbi:MAG TPA: DUF4388 domain-containing protein, partial [Proteobacteria bacterium]|nr:DUF4388 domain-containing protein [Pseudomonadota bacterium]